MKKSKLLYVYRKRIPSALRKLVLDLIPNDEFIVKSMNYSLPDRKKMDLMKWAEFVLFAPGRHLSTEVMKSGSRVKLMQLWSSGYDKFNIRDSNKFGIPVANNGGGNAISVAEHTILLMLAVYKKLRSSIPLKSIKSFYNILNAYLPNQKLHEDICEYTYDKDVSISYNPETHTATIQAARTKTLQKDAQVIASARSITATYSGSEESQDSLKEDEEIYSIKGLLSQPKCLAAVWTHS